MSYLSELYRFYERMTAEPDSGMPPEGMTAENIAFALVIGRDGALRSVADLRDSKGKTRRLIVPASVSRSSNIAPNFLWDKTEYVLGVGSGEPKELQKKAAAFRQCHKTLLGACEDVHAQALLAFLNRWTPDAFAALEERDALMDANVAFRLEGEERFLHEAPALKELWLAHWKGKNRETNQIGICLATGRHETLARTHPLIKGIPGAQTSGASLVSFNCPAFESYGKTQSYNAPVSERAASGYACALNYLLAKEHRQMTRIADTSMIFWADSAVPEEKLLGDIFDLEPARATVQDVEQIRRLKGILLALRQGKPLNEADAALHSGVRFFILGLAPNAARLSVRFWLSGTLGRILHCCSRWYEDLEIERQFPDSEPEFPPLWQLLNKGIAAPGQQNAIPPELGGQLSLAMLTGSKIPESVFAAVLRRIRADKDDKKTRKMNYFRAALIKAYLCRNKHEENDMTTLNTEETNIGYRLGRLFALLEKAQKDALGNNVNAPLRERYIGAASATPRTVFPMLLRLAQHHVVKAKKSRFPLYDNFFDKKAAEILAGVTDFPATLPLEDQGRFMLGYYHQNNDFYQNKADSQETEYEE